MDLNENIIVSGTTISTVFLPVLRHSKIFQFSMEPVPKRMKIQHFQQERGLMDLSNEVLELIFLQLSQSDIQHNVALVCRSS